MTQFEPKNLTILDPRTFDGDPFTVAQRAAEQAEALVKLAAEQAELAELMHRNSFMEAILQAGDELTPGAWDNSPYSTKWADVKNDLLSVVGSMRSLGGAAGYDPKHPPKAE